LSPASPVFCALDRPDRARALGLARAVAPHVGGLKVGLEFFTACGPEGVREVVGLGRPVFLDLKLHDIPNTVAGAAAAAAAHGASMITVHASGGPAMIAAAAAAAPDVAILAVTVLTSLDDATLSQLGLTVAAIAVPALAKRAEAAGATGIVCAGDEVAAVREVVGTATTVVVPGVRPATAAQQDQARVVTPEQAVRAGADLLVVGRPVTAADDPVGALRDIRRQVSACVSDR
jgi:orotidine-5'-phosphate decarboxylase